MATRTIEVCDVCEKAAREMSMHGVSLFAGDDADPVYNAEAMLCKRCAERALRMVRRAMSPINRRRKNDEQE